MSKRKEGRLEPARVALATLVQNPRNPRLHPEEQLERLAASIKRFGQTRPVLARRANMMIVAGHGVTEACRRAGLAEVDVLLWDVDQETADAFMLGDNRFAQLGRDDAGRVRELLRQHGFTDPESIGFSAVEVEDLLADAVDDLELVEVPTTTVSDRFWISVRGPLPEQARALDALKGAMQGLAGVEVELGTIADE